MKDLAIAIAAVAVFGLGISITVANWQECRAVHSFMYCVQTLSR